MSIGAPGCSKNKNLYFEEICATLYIEAPEDRMILQIIMKRNFDPIVAAEKAVSYARMTGIYSGAGFDVYFSYANEIDDVLSVIVENKPDLVLCGIDHLPDKNANIIISHNVHKLFELHNVHYIGSGHETIELALSKVALKRRWEAFGIRTPPFVFIGGAQDYGSALEELVSLNAFPYIVKPENLGNSRGIDEQNIVWDAADLEPALKRVRSQYGGALLVEHYLGAYSDVAEITCAMIQGAECMHCMPARVNLAQPKRFHLITTDDKDGNRTFLSPLDPEMAASFVSFAQKAFETAGVRDYARGDFFFADGKLWAIEINGQPMIPDRWFKGAVQFVGLSEAQYLVGIVAAGYRRLRSERRIVEPFPAGAQALLKGTILDGF
jgi:D-alanine-D-alanine ligase-like ATP-grasp enzyme